MPEQERISITLNGNLYLLFGVTLMVVMSVSSISPAFPKIMNELGISKMQVGLLISCFTIPGVIFSPVFGVLADRWGRKKILVPALFLFGIAGGACAATTSFPLILVFRMFQGMGASALGTVGLTVLGDLYPGRERTVVMGYNNGILSTGTASYPALGGALAMFGWRYPFLLPLAAIPLGVLVWLFLDNPEPSGGQDFADYARNALAGMRNRQAAGLFALGVVTYMMLYGCFITYLPILLADSFGLTSLAIGLLMSVTSVATGITSTRIGRLMQRYPERSLLKVGFLFYAAAMAVFPLVTSLWWFIVPAILFGIGMGINIPCLQSMLTSMAPMKYRAAFLSLYNMALRAGQTIGPLAMGLVFMAGGIGSVFLAGAALAALMFAVSFFTFDTLET